jgi:hypothetical protein
MPINYAASTVAITLAPIKGQLCGAKRGGDNNYSPEIGTLDQGVTRKRKHEKSPFREPITATIKKIR